MSEHLSRAGEWFLQAGIQESNGGVARYYRLDVGHNHRVSTEITGYAIRTFVWLHAITNDPRYLERVAPAARYLTRTAWDPASRSMPFETDPSAFTYFFDCGIIVRGLLAAWGATRIQEFLDVAAALGDSMALDFVSESGDFHPVLALPGKRPLERDRTRWSQSPGCYQLKSAMGWWDLFEATGERRFRELYERVLNSSLRTYGSFLPGHTDRAKVMDRLHAFLYFLEGLLPRAGEARCAAAICDGIRRVAQHLHEIAPEFERSDVYAQLLRMRLHADRAGITPLDRDAAQLEAKVLAGFQAHDSDPRIDGGYYFGRRGGSFLPYINPVSTAFALQARALWDERASSDAPGDGHDDDAPWRPRLLI